MCAVTAGVLTPGLLSSAQAGAATDPVGPIVTGVQVELIQLENQLSNAVSNVVITVGDIGCLTGTQDPATCPPWL